MDRSWLIQGGGPCTLEMLARQHRQSGVQLACIAHLCVVLKQGPGGLKTKPRVETGHHSNLATEIRDALPGPLAQEGQKMLKNHGDAYAYI